MPTPLLIGGASPPRQQPNCEELAARSPTYASNDSTASAMLAHDTLPDLVAGLIGSFLGNN